MRYLSVALPIPVFRLFYYSSKDDVEIGSRVKVPFGRTIQTGYVIDIFNAIPSVNYPIKNIKEVVDQKSLISFRLMELARCMSDYYLSPLGEMLSVILPVALRSLKRKRKIDEQLKGSYEKKEILPEQKKEVEPIMKKAVENVPAKFLVHGVTDREKTEVYMRIITDLINLKKQVIMLVPEIAITAQLKEMFLKRFPVDKIGIWHSRITPGKKMDYIQKIFSGKLDVLVGPRSAVFAPFPNLGAIIIDDEQDPSYKNHSSPLYDARWVAEKRSELENAVLIYGSTVPSVETLYRVRAGEINYLKTSLNDQDNQPLLIVVNMKKERKIFSKYLLDELKKTLEKKKQSIIFLNRRGYAPSVICENCGEIIKCPNCNISLVYHSSQEKLICHWCEYRQVMPRECPACKGITFKYSGMGTQRVEKALNKIFPQARIVRMDIDSTMKSGSVDVIFKDFKYGKYDIMIGTQIVAKGWDFSNVELVGVINSDIGLMMPDFRATERIFSLLKQVGLRVCRTQNRGKVVVQTSNPEHYGIKMLFEKDMTKFFEKELSIRKDAKFPPFTKLINIVSAHKDENKARENIYFCKSFIEKNGDILLGPAPAPVYKIRGKFRWQLLIKYLNEENIKEKLKEMIMKKNFAGKLKIDVDPQEML